MSNNNNYSNLVNGKWEISQEKIKLYSPIDGNFIGTIPSMKSEEIDVAVSCAKKKINSWKGTHIQHRAEILLKAANLLEENKEHISNIMLNEIAKPYSSCVSEIIRTAQMIRYTVNVSLQQKGEILYGSSYDSNNNSKCYIERVPYGVVLAIAPFNYPINLAASKIAPALILGNTVVVKPPTQGCMSTLELIKIFHQAGIPDGVINSVSGKGSNIGNYLISHKDIDFINFTGSSSVGLEITRLCGFKPVLFEMGGKDAALVIDDYNIKRNAKEIIRGAFDYSGQRCTAIKRVFVLKQYKEILEKEIVKNIDRLTVGSPKKDCNIVPLISIRSVDFAKSLYEDAVNKGCVILKKFYNEKNLMHPVVLSNVTKDMKVAWEEPFSPILPIIPVDSIEEMIILHNMSDYGLQASIFTKDINLANDISKKLEVGTININQKTQRGPDNFPFLGVKSSGVGVQGIEYSLQSMSRIRSIVY